MHAHITNRSFNKGHADYDAALHNVPLSRCGALGCGGSQGVGGGDDDEDDDEDTKGLWAQMRQITGVLFGMLSGSKRHFFAMANCYELFG